MTSTVELQCPICSSLTEEKTILKNGRVFYHCSNCGFSGLDPAFFLSASEEKSRYDLHENSINDPGYVAMFEKFINFAITPYKVKTILDYGSGPGPVLAELLSRKNYDVSIYDPFYADSNFADFSFDMVCSTEVFEHFNKPMEEIGKIVKLVKPGGYIAIMTRFRPAIDKFKSWFYKDDTTHVSFYSPKTFEFIAKQFSLEIIEHDSFQTILLKKKG